MSFSYIIFLWSKNAFINNKNAFNNKKQAGHLECESTFFFFLVDKGLLYFND